MLDYNQEIVKSRGRNTIRIYMGINFYGLPIGFKVTGRKTHNRSKAASNLIESLPKTQCLIADRDKNRHLLSCVLFPDFNAR